MSIEEIEARRAKRKAEQEEAEKAQYEVDLEALDALEAEHGVIAAVRVTRFVKGHPTRAFLKTPTQAQYKRYVDQVAKAHAKDNKKAVRDAQELLAKSCWVYPKEEKEREAMLDAFPGILTSIAISATALAEGRAEEEGKG